MGEVPSQSLVVDCALKYEEPQKYEVPAQSLVQSLIDVVDDIASIGEFRRVHKKESANLARRVKLLAPLFEEIKEFKGLLPDSAIGAFNALERALHSAKLVLRLCHDGSKLFVVMEMDEVARRFQSVTAELVQALDRLPYNLLDVSDEVREQVDLVHNQLKRAKGRIDVQDVQLVADIQSLLMAKGSNDPDSAVLDRLSEKLELRTKSAVRQEQKALHKMRKCKELDDVNFNTMSYILEQILVVAEIDAPQSMSGASDGISARFEKIRLATAEQSTLADIPDEYRCPISLEPMRDPVILASGQTYERACIQKWLDDGNRTCPITRGLLSHQNLTPNYVLRSLIAQWCEAHGIEAPKRTSKLSRVRHSSSEASQDAASVGGLLHKLASMDEDEQRTAAGELRLLAKRSDENRICIAKAGAIPLLVKLLRTQDWRTQEHAVTALLNLSINDTNKGAIVLAGAINPIVEVLKSGSMEARENAAATLFSLSVPDDHKVTIGASGAIPALVDLLKGGTARGKKDAATALFNLSIYVENKARAVRAGVVPPLMELLIDPTAGMVDEALAILAILASHHDGRMAIGQASAIPTLVELIRSGSARNKENAAAILLALGMSDPVNVTLATKLGAYTPLTELSQTGTTRAKRKSSQLLEQMKKLSFETAPGLSSQL